MVRAIKGLIIILLISSGAHAATLHGTIYEWSDFDKPLRNTIVELGSNSTRVQMNVSTTGTYLFDKISPGNYTIKARYYRNNILEYTGEETIRIDRMDESRNIDLLLFPPTDPEYEYLGDINLTDEIYVRNENSLNVYIILFLAIIFSAFVFYWIRKRKSRTGEITTNEMQVSPPASIAEPENIPEDLRNLYDMILKAGGRITQKELRKKMPYSEAKVSLMLDDLENRGLIKKIKKGRSNIIIADVQK